MFFEFRLQDKYPEIRPILKEIFTEKENIEKKPSKFEPEELEKFFRTFDAQNRFELVRAVVAVIGFFGVSRLDELKSITFGGKLKTFFIP